MVSIIIIAIVALLPVAIFLFIQFSISSIHEKSLPDLDLDSLKIKGAQKTNVLFIFPHPDDETIATGGLIKKMTLDNDFRIFVISLSKGEKGKEILDISDGELAKIREKEFHNAVKTLGVDKKRTAAWDFPDGSIEKNIGEIKKQVELFLKQNKINLVITFEKTGMYGHPDHMALSKIVHELSSNNLNIKTLYSTLPRKIYNKLDLPTKLHYGDKVVDLESLAPVKPEFKLALALGVMLKHKAASMHKSQKLGTDQRATFYVNHSYEYYSERWE